MPNNSYYPPDEPTQPSRWSGPPNQNPTAQPGSDQQGKLVLGSFKDNPSSRPANRSPYQNPVGPPQQPSWAAPAQPQFQQQQSPSQQPGYYSPNAAPQAGGFGQPGGGVAPLPGQRNLRRPRRRRGCMIGCLTLLVLLCVVGIFGTIVGQRVMAFGSAISTQSPLSTQTGYMGTSDRVNVLVLGYGGGAHQGAVLTDSMVVMSLLPQSQHTTLVSVPRDLYVQVPANSGHYQKINAVYESGSNNGADPNAGGVAAAQKVSLITGLDIKYYLTINFEGFRDLIDAMGGIDVYVPDAFTALYPKNDDPNVDASYIKIHFNKGQQHMNGETAIRYARARKTLDNLAEGTDFARSARQQIIIKAAISKAKQSSTWPHLFNAMDALKKTIFTNLSLADLAQFSLKMDLTNAHRIGLSNQNVLVDSTSPDGQYILKPANDNWGAIVDYVHQHLYA